MIFAHKLAIKLDNWVPKVTTETIIQHAAVLNWKQDQSLAVIPSIFPVYTVRIIHKISNKT